MIDKEYLKQLKEEDYIAYDDLVNDPMVTGGDDSFGSVFGFCLFMVIGIVCVVVILLKCKG